MRGCVDVDSVLGLLHRVDVGGFASFWEMYAADIPETYVDSIFTIKLSRSFSESLCLKTLSIIRNSNELENTTFQRLDPFRYSGVERETSTLLGPLERANLNHWTAF
jgi:hypothetical protein